MEANHHRPGATSPLAAGTSPYVHASHCPLPVGPPRPSPVLTTELHPIAHQRSTALRQSGAFGQIPRKSHQADGLLAAN